MTLVIVLSTSPVLSDPAVDSAPKALDECVILLHGLARTNASMSSMEEALAESGYRVVNDDYPSRKGTIESLAQVAIPRALERCGDTRKVHFVTHSMGGILVRYFLSGEDIPRLARVVMLGPPNGGSEVVDKLAEMPGYEMINGPAGQQLGTGPADLPRSLGPANFDVGIIAGRSTVNPLLSLLIPGDDDGKVSIENAKLAGMRDFLVVDHSHPFIMTADVVICQTIHFLKFGRFDRSRHGCRSTA